MDRLNYIVMMLEKTLGTRSKRHIMGGALVSVSLLFGGLALTVMTLKTENNDEGEEEPKNELQVY
jgi:hypothetical protein